MDNKVIIFEGRVWRWERIGHDDDPAPWATAAVATQPPGINLSVADFGFDAESAALALANTVGKRVKVTIEVVD